MWIFSTGRSIYEETRRQTVTESTIIATIHCPDVGYCLFGNPLVTYICYHVPCTFLIVIVSYWVVHFLVRLLAPFVPYTYLRYSTLPTIYYWICTSVAISYLLILLLVLLVISCRLYPYVLGLSCFATMVALLFDILGQDTWLCFICI